MANQTNIQSWIAENSIEVLLGEAALLLDLSLRSEAVVDSLFNEETKWLWLIVVLLSSLLLPFNLLGLIVIVKKYLVGVNQMVRAA